MMVGSNLKDSQLQQIVDKVIKNIFLILKYLFFFVNRQLLMQTKMVMEKLVLMNFVL